MATTLYHVAKSWDGGDLLSLQRLAPWSDDVAAGVADKWPDCDPWAYYSTEGRFVHCHATLAEAVDYRDEWCEGGTILEVEVDDSEVEVGREYPHPVVRHEIDARCVRVVDPAGAAR